MAIETFILRFLSPDTGCSYHEMRFEADPCLVASIFDVEPWQLTTCLHYPDEIELVRLEAELKLAVPNSADEIVLQTLHEIDRLPYLVHTNFELPLMLDGRKPFAVFTDGTQRIADVRKYFEPHVREGTIIESVRDILIYPVHTIQASFALPGEEWRFGAYDELMGGPRPWTDEMERRLGMILGYTSEQCEWWITNRSKKASP
jgi:hypothetical protein